ncbi:MAG: hypothetical protein ORN98_00250 [Alphaproteobacteria bacterium]|nr:hypothetical protein [Alphaproteobacteria bacterium]
MTAKTYTIYLSRQSWSQATVRSKKSAMTMLDQMTLARGCEGCVVVDGVIVANSNPMSTKFVIGQKYPPSPPPPKPTLQNITVTPGQLARANIAAAASSAAEKRLARRMAILSSRGKI